MAWFGQTGLWALTQMSFQNSVGTQVGLVGAENFGHGGTIENSDEEEMTFTLLNSFWFMIASLLQQGTDLLPR